MYFTKDEVAVIGIYQGRTREQAIQKIMESLGFIDDEAMHEVTVSVLTKLDDCSESEYQEIRKEALMEVNMENREADTEETAQPAVMNREELVAYLKGLKGDVQVTITVDSEEN